MEANNRTGLTWEKVGQELVQLAITVGTALATAGIFNLLR